MTTINQFVEEQKNLKDITPVEDKMGYFAVSCIDHVTLLKIIKHYQEALEDEAIRAESFNASITAKRIRKALNTPLEKL